MTDYEKNSQEVLEIHQKNIDEILQYIRVNKVSNIPHDAVFSNGDNMGTWYENYLRYPVKFSFDEKLKGMDKCGAYLIAKELYNSKTTSPHEGLPFDYGSSLRRVFAIYYMNFQQLFTIFGIPRTFMQQILENKIVPSEKLILNVLRFLQSLAITDVYEKEFVKDAISTYESLKKMHLKGDSLSFILCPKEKENTYLSLWKDFDSSILKKVKESKNDWYLKCITIYFIIYKERKAPTSSMQYYFYDGSIASKWLTTQKRFLEGKNGTLLPEQVSMLQHIYDLLAIIEYEHKCKNDEEVILSTSFDSVCQSFADAIEKYEDIPQDVYYENVLLRNLWYRLEEQLKNQRTPYTNKQIMKIKELRHKVIFNQKKKNKTQAIGNINFGYELACFMDGLDLSLPKAASMFWVSFQSMAHYSRNFNLPSREIVNKMLYSLSQLDLSSYRQDQIQDIENFKKVLNSLENKASLEDAEFDLNKVYSSMDIALLTGELEKDVSLTYLKEVQATDSLWYQEFKKLYVLIYQGMQEDNKSFIHLKTRQWFIKESYKVFKGESTVIKGELLRYLYYFYKKVELRRKEILFVNRFTVLESFIYENKRIPYIGELLLVGNQDGRKFYATLKDNLYGFKDYYKDLAVSMLEHMKLLMQYVMFCRREKAGYRKDEIVGIDLFLGERITNIRICLGFTKDSFSNRLGWSAHEMFLLYSNRMPLKEQHVESLLQLFEEMKGKNLRRDQLEEIQNFILVLTTKKLDDDFYLRFSPKK